MLPDGGKTPKKVPTRSSCVSLNAEARSTKDNGRIVVQRLVGETSGICCMQAVNRKNKLAYFENCSAAGDFEICQQLSQNNVQKMKSERHAPKRNLGTNVTALYLLVEM